MSTDTKHTTAVIGTIVATGVALAGFLTTSLGGRITNVENEVRALRAEFRQEIQATDRNLREEIRATRTELREEIHSTRTELREEIRALDGRVRTVETGFARVDQRLAIIERAVIPPAEPPQ
ncbi:MAG: hypothetical protein OXI15_02225 [Chromatiales bacterium]|nr:hypothetical protein [Chromatiales bacterium]